MLFEDAIYRNVKAVVPLLNDNEGRYGRKTSRIDEDKNRSRAKNEEEVGNEDGIGDCRVCALCSGQETLEG